MNHLLHTSSRRKIVRQQKYYTQKHKDRKMACMLFEILTDLSSVNCSYLNVYFTCLFSEIMTLKEVFQSATDGKQFPTDGA